MLRNIRGVIERARREAQAAVQLMQETVGRRIAAEEAVHICKVNASAGLSARPTMSWMAVYSAQSIVEAAARVESHAASLLESGVVEALDYACVNDFGFVGASVSSYAAGALVALVGRNEGGKTLSRSTVNAVLDTLADHFDSTHWRITSPASRMMSYLRRITTVAIADANKKIMLQHDKLLDLLVTGLLLDDDNPRRGQDGADALQEACAGVLHELALYGPGAATMRSHKPTMDALRVLAELVVGADTWDRMRAAGPASANGESTPSSSTSNGADGEDDEAMPQAAGAAAACALACARFGYEPAHHRRDKGGGCRGHEGDHSARASDDLRAYHFGPGHGRHGAVAWQEEPSSRQWHALGAQPRPARRGRPL